MAKKVSKSKTVKAWVYSPTANEAQKAAITKDFEPLIEELKKKYTPKLKKFTIYIDLFFTM